MQKIDIEDAKKQPEVLFNLAANEEEIIITVNEKPLFKLSRFNETLHRKRGSAKNLIKFSTTFDESLEEFEEYMS